MTKYLVVLRLGGQRVKTAVYAESATHARLLVEYAWGFDSVVSNPVSIKEGGGDYPLYDNITPKPPSIKPKPPMTLPQARINGLKQGVERSQQQLKQERERQRQQRETERTRQQQQKRF